MMRWIRNWSALLAVALMAATPLSYGATAGEAQTLVKETADKVLSRLEQDRAKLKKNPQLIYPVVEDLVLPHFDFEKMSQFVLGPAWRQASAEQRQRFTAEFRNLLVRTYAKALLEYKDQTIAYLPMQGEEKGDKVVVRTQIEQKGSNFPIPLNYAMYQKNGEWKVYDLVVDNVSLVSNYRKSFASEIRQGSIDQLIVRLEDMNKRGAEQGG